MIMQTNPMEIGKMASIVLFFVYVMFFIPKMDLISLGGGFNAGLRIDDLIICLLFFFFFLYAAQNKKTKVSKTEFYFILFLFVTFLGSFFSSTQYGRGTVLFPIRFFEYFVFFYMGFFLYKGGANIRK